MTAPTLRALRPPLTGGDLRSRLVADLPASDRRLRIDGIPTAVLEAGDGPPVVLLHGAGEFGAIWTRVLPELAATHRVIAPDLPGHGETGSGGDALDVLRWLDRLVDRTTTAPAVLVGHHLGGAIAARHAARRPDRVRGLVLVDSFGLARLRPSPKFALALIPFMVRPTQGTHNRLLQHCVADLDGLRASMGEKLDLLQAYAVDRARNGGVTSVVRRLMRQFGVPAIPEEELARITAPTTLIWGRQDAQTRLSVAEAASARYGWPLHVMDEAGDDPAVECPEEFLEALRAGLDATEEDR